MLWYIHTTHRPRHWRLGTWYSASVLLFNWSRKVWHRVFEHRMDFLASFRLLQIAKTSFQFTNTQKRNKTYRHIHDSWIILCVLQLHSVRVSIEFVSREFHDNFVQLFAFTNLTNCFLRTSCVCAFLQCFSLTCGSQNGSVDVDRRPSVGQKLN